MGLRIFKYLSPLVIYLGAFLSFGGHGFEVWIPLIYTWFLVPLLELFIWADESNLSEAEEELAKKNRWYDFLVYVIVPIQYTALAFFLYSVTYQHQGWVDILGKTLVMGLLCGVFGINVGHELGHRVNKGEQLLAKMLLLTSLYMHFFIEHNKGHHKRVATPEDPSSARYGEMVYAFYFRTVFLSYLSAWEISSRDCRKKGHTFLSFHNEMIVFHLVQFAFVAAIFLFFGWLTTLLFVFAALN
ncbi:MAG: fatty acid desaturase, partial [Candidatus Dadabacteria bacterium]